MTGSAVDRQSYSPGRPFSELRTSGLLWLINTSVFHPRGLALAIHFKNDAAGAPTGWSLLAAPEGEAYDFTPEVVDELFRAAEETMRAVRTGGRP